MHSPPAFQIEVPIEGAPRIRWWAEHFEDERMLRLWVETHPELARLLEDVRRIAERMEAA